VAPLASAQVHRGLEISSLRDDIVLILIVGYVCYSTITSGSSQHSAVVLFVLCVAVSERNHLDAVYSGDSKGEPGWAMAPQILAWPPQLFS